MFFTCLSIFLMDKKQAIKSIEHFTEASLSAVYDGNAPATKSDLQKLRSDIAQLAKELLDAFSK